MTEEEKILIADEIMNVLGPDTQWKWDRTVFNKIKLEGMTEARMKTVAKILMEDKLINIRESRPGNVGYELEPKAVGLLNAGKGYADFLQEKTEKEAKQLEKEEQDRKHKNLQIEDLEFRLKTVEDMQERQKRFWAKQNISLFISGLSLIVAFIALIAKCSSKS